MTISEITAIEGTAEALAIAVPRHVAIIMDGNGRWAARRRRPRTDGHRAGITNIRDVIRYFSQRGVSYVTLFAFSTENWERPSDEVTFITGDLLQSALGPNSILPEKYPTILFFFNCSISRLEIF